MSHARASDPAVPRKIVDLVYAGEQVVVYLPAPLNVFLHRSKQRVVCASQTWKSLIEEDVLISYCCMQATGFNVEAQDLLLGPADSVA